MQNISFNDSGYVIKPLQPSSAIYRAPPFTGNPIILFRRGQSMTSSVNHDVVLSLTVPSVYFLTVEN